MNILVYLRKIRDFLKYKITPSLQDLKRLHLFVFLYNVCICCIYFIINNCEVSLECFMHIILCFIEFYVLWGVSTVVMMGQYVERDEAILKGKNWIKPGRYYMMKVGRRVFIREMRTSPVDDFYHFVMIVLFILFPILIIQLFIQKSMEGFLFIHGLLAIVLSMLRETYRLEKDYVKNMEKAKVI